MPATPSCSLSWSVPIATTTAVAGDSDLSEGIKVLARAHQNMIWDRTRATNRLRCALREYFPAALHTFAELADRDTLAVLGAAPDPDAARKLTPGRVRTLLRAAGRQRNIDTRAQTIVEGLRTDALSAPPAVVSAFAATTRAQVALIAELNTQIAGLETELAAHFEQHPGVGQEQRRVGPLRAQHPPRRCHRPMGVLRVHQQPRRPPLGRSPG